MLLAVSLEQVVGAPLHDLCAVVAIVIATLKQFFCRHKEVVVEVDPRTYEAEWVCFRCLQRTPAIALSPDPDIQHVA